ncbi:MAG TPA: site-specific integrase [Candidatus Coprenecus pullistercoris]|nr:site-specific integrase [Candidatus Coprenecus pullistercoris]
MLKFSRKGISVSVVLDRRRIKVNGMYPVKIEVVWNRKQKYFPTGVDMSENDWKRLSEKHRKSYGMEEIEECFSRIRGEVSDMLDKGVFSLEVLEVRSGRSKRFNVNKAFRQEMERCMQEGRINSFYRYRSTLLNLERYAGEDIQFSSITAAWLERCGDFWADEGKSATTVCIYMKTLKGVVNKAVAEGYIKGVSYPFGRNGYVIPKGAVRKIALSKEHIKKLMNYKGPAALEEYRDLWVFSYLCNGINFKDMLSLRYGNVVDGEIWFIRSKTRYAYGGSKIIHAVLSPQMRAIISRWGNPAVSSDTYIFRFMDDGKNELDAEILVRNVIRRCNAALKKIAGQLGIPVFTTYSARHSFATVMQRSGVDLPYISECLGHSSLAVTKNYLAGFCKEDRLRNSALLTDFD